MKKRILSIVFALVLVCSLALVTAVPAAAATGGRVTFEFHASDLINVYPDGVGSPSTDVEHSEQANARQLRDRTVGVDEYGVWQYNTFTTLDSYNAYKSWREGLGDNEGISAFNIWLLDEVNAKAWGETTVSRPDTPVTATCPDGWDYQIIEDPYGDRGFVIEWYTTDPTKYLRPDEDQGVFSFTVDVYHDKGPANWDANDPPVQVGETCRIWFGCNLQYDNEGYSDEPFTPGFEFDAEGWGDLATYLANSPGPFSSALYETGGTNQGELLQFDATLDLVAKAGTTVDLSAVVPVPPEKQIGIRVDQTSISFGSITPGVASQPRTVIVTNIGNVAEDFSASLTNISIPDVYTDGLRIDAESVSLWGEANVAATEAREEVLILTVDGGTAPGTYTATLIFWAEMH